MESAISRDTDNVFQEENLEELIGSITKLGYSSNSTKNVNYFENDYDLAFKPNLQQNTMYNLSPSDDEWSEKETDHSLTNMSIMLEEISDGVKDMIDNSVDVGDRLTELEVLVKNLQFAIKGLNERMDAIGVALTDNQKFNSGVIASLSYINNVLLAKYGPVTVKHGGNLYSVTPNGSKLLGKDTGDEGEGKKDS